jgi:hypothetical protein
MAAFVPGLAAALVAALPPSCSLTEGYRHRWEATEPPWVLYADQNCPSDRGVVEDSALWSCLAVQQVSNASSGAVAQSCTFPFDPRPSGQNCTLLLAQVRAHSRLCAASRLHARLAG